MPSYYFYKAVLDAHIRGVSLLAHERGAGIRGEGLNPAKRNASGGATAVAAAQSGRQLSSADTSGIGQCLSGSLSYATAYCTSDNHVVLRVTMTSDDLNTLVKSADTHAMFDSMDDAVAASECTSIAIIPPSRIEYSIEGNDKWAPIADYKSKEPKNWFDSGSDSESDDGF